MSTRNEPFLSTSAARNSDKESATQALGLRRSRRATGWSISFKNGPLAALGRVLASFTLILSVDLNVLPSAQQARAEVHGSWTATAGSNRTFWGTWTAQVSPDKPNSPEGSWALLNEGGQTLLEGTWAANKTRFGWQGAWAARTLTGESFSGTWSADITGSKDKTFQQMLEWTLEKDILGSWRSDHSQGKWRLKGSPQGGQGR